MTSVELCTDLHNNIRLLPDFLHLHNFGTRRFVISIGKVRGNAGALFDEHAKPWFDQFGYGLINWQAMVGLTKIRKTFLISWKKHQILHAQDNVKPTHLRRSGHAFLQRISLLRNAHRQFRIGDSLGCRWLLIGGGGKCRDGCKEPRLGWQVTKVGHTGSVSCVEGG